MQGIEHTRCYTLAATKKLNSKIQLLQLVYNDEWLAQCHTEILMEHQSKKIKNNEGFSNNLKFITMAFYWRLKKKNYYFTAIELKKLIPELKKCSAEEIENNLRGSDMEFFYSEKIKTPLMIRITLPIALIVVLLLVLGMPLNYIICGKWGYKWEWLSNWLRSLGF